MIHDEICTYEVCKLAKEKGFNVPTAEFYNDDGNIGCYPRAFNHNEFPDGDYAAPTQSLLQRWLREEKKLHITINSAYEWGVDDLQYPQERNISVGIGAFGLFDTYEDALEDALKYALENLVI